MNSFSQVMLCLASLSMSLQWSLHFKTTHGTKKKGSYIAGGLKIKVIKNTEWHFGGLKIKGCK